MKRYEIWSEGFADSRDRGQAYRLGYGEGATFREACMAFMNADKEHLQLRYFNGKELTYWGCRLFDNEVDARKSFG
ncbi:hypothetical protein [Gorillibacterium sp. CAU 1737]|uniref:hypothetical protein n=1 Tax=Gorillibacterium sp. CAU 1737 TaxID=3140362 RepID=UPI003261B9EF